MIDGADSFCQRLGYVFSNKEFLQRALSHRSLGKRNNERLEFLGDAILGYVIAEALYRAFPQATEGELSRLRASLVKLESLAEIARELDLGQVIRLGAGELKSGGFNRDSILADAMEAIMAAIYLDSDLETTRGRILDLYASRLSALTLVRENKDPKTRLQELLQSRHSNLPVYTVVEVKGKEHAQVFCVECRIDDYNVCVQASGDSRRKAEQAAAQSALDGLRI